MNERTRRGGSEPLRLETRWPEGGRALSSAKHLGPPILGHAIAPTEDATIREALNVVLGWAELLLEGVVDGSVRRRAVGAIERNARVLRTLSLDDHGEAVSAIEAALRVCADLRASGEA